MACKRALSSLSQTIERVPRLRTAISVYTNQAVQTRLSSSLLPQTRLSQPSMPRLRQPKRHFTTSFAAYKDNSSSSQSSSGSPPSRLYTFSEIQTLAESPDPKRILIDVREPSELQSTGKIPGSYNLPISSGPDAFFLPAEEFEERFGWQKPGEEAEVIFYCKAGVRSRAAASLAGQAGFGGKIGEFPGSWIEWEANGGKAEKET